MTPTRLVLGLLAATWLVSSAGCSDDSPGTNDNNANAPVCGDGQQEGTEECDTDELNGEDCASLGFDGGMLVCADNCAFDSSGCYVCGDDTLNGNEQCDGTDLGTETCATQGIRRWNVGLRPRLHLRSGCLPFLW